MKKVPSPKVPKPHVPKPGLSFVPKKFPKIKVK